MSLRSEPKIDLAPRSSDGWHCAAQYLARLDTVDSKGAIERDLTEICDLLGLAYYSYVCSVPGSERQGSSSSPMLLTNYPEEWQQRYRSKAYHVVDPVVIRGSRQRRPFIWGDPDYILRLPHAAQRLWAEGRHFGIESGATIPVHGPLGEWGLFSVSSGQSMADFRRHFAELDMTLELLAGRVHAAAVERIIGTTAEAEVALTGNEQVCLAWTLRGKTAWEISRIIGRSKSTVDYHVQVASKKLGAANKVHAAFKALQSGLL